MASSTIFLHQINTVSSSASCLVTGFSIRCLRRYKKSHRAQAGCLNSDSICPLPKDTLRQVSSSVATPDYSLEGQSSPVGYLSHPLILCRHLSNAGTFHHYGLMFLYLNHSLDVCRICSCSSRSGKTSSFSTPLLYFLAPLGLVKVFQAF